MKTTKKYQHNGEFEQLLDAKLDLLEMAYREAETAEAQAEVLKNYGFDIHEFYLSAIRKVLAQMIKLNVQSCFQRTADYLGLGRRTVYDNQ